MIVPPLDLPAELGPAGASPRPDAELADGARALADALPFLVAIVADGRVVHGNPALCALLGRELPELVGRSFHDLVQADAAGTAPALLAASGDPASARGARDGDARQARATARVVRADGGEAWLDLRLDAIRLGGRPATLISGQEVTAERRAPTSLDEPRPGEGLLAEAQRVGHIGSWEWDVASSRLAWSDELCRIYGTRPDEFGETLEGYLALVHPDDREATRALMVDALARGGSFAFEHRIVRGSTASSATAPVDPGPCEEEAAERARVRVIAGIGEVFLGPDGSPRRVVGTGQDITERRRTEEELRRSEERFRSLCTQAPVMLLALDPCGRIRDVSDCWLQTMGYARAEVIGEEGFRFVQPSSHERLRQAIVERTQDGIVKNLPIQGRRRDGGSVDLLCTSVAEVGDRGESRGAICVQLDLTDLQRAEAALRESEERYRALVEHAPEAIMVLDVDLGRFVDANAHAERLFGYPRERLLAMGPLDFCSEHQADGRESCEVMEEESRQVLAGETRTFEFTHLAASGREIHCQTRLTRLPTAGRRLIRATTTDISERRRLEEKMRHADRLAAAGALAAGVAHEIGNPLMALSMAAQSLEKRSGGDDYTAAKLALIREHSERISRIVRQMSELARPYRPQKARLDLNRVVRRAVELARYDRRAQGSEVTFELREPLPEVVGAEDELSQVCINLALNAFDAMAANDGRERRLTVASSADAARVRVSFRDTGHGVPPAVRDRLFQPFFTTKDPGRGTGLGLSVSYRILEEHEGALRLDAQVTPGAAFVFELPAALAT